MTKSFNPGNLDITLAGMQESYWGPMDMVLSGLLLVLLCLRFCKEKGGLKFWLVIFVYLILTKWEVLFFPAYGDTIAGPFAEAIWLKDNHFDYFGLWQQPGYIYGGPKVYLFSIYPTFLAALMRLIPSVTLFFVMNHLAAFALGAMTIVYFRKIVLSFLPVSTATLSSLLFLSLPLFQAQVEAINMEVPMVSFAVAALYYVGQRDWPKAAVFSVLALIVKGVAIFISATVVMMGLLSLCIDDRKQSTGLFFTRYIKEASIRLFFSKRKGSIDDHSVFSRRKVNKIKTIFWISIPFVFSILQFYGSVYVLNAKDGRPDMVGPWQGWYHIKENAATYLYAVCIGLFFSYISYEKIVKKFSWTLLLRKHYMGLLVFVAAGGWFGIFINSLAGFPRYKLLLLPLIVLCVFYTASLLIKNEKVLNRFLTGLILIFFLSSYGLFHQPQEGADHVSDHVILERSLEYRSDIKLKMRVAREIEENFYDYTISAPFLIAHILAMPELGYVHKKLTVLIYGFPCTYGGITPFKGLSHLDILKTLWVGVKQVLPAHMGFSDTYPVNARDKVLKEIVEGNRKATLFLGGFSIEKMRVISKIFLKALAEQGQLKNPHEHNFGL